MKFNPTKPLHVALDSINAAHGTGQVSTVLYNPGRQIGSYTVLRQYGTGQYLWQIKADRVYARGTSCMIGGKP
jgi:hypothetical protein